MFEILPLSTGALLAVRASGKISVEDYEKTLFPKLDELFATHEKLNILIQFDENFAGWSSPQAAIDDAKIGFEHPNGFDKIALVGAPQWFEWGMKLYSLFVSGQLRSFPAGGREDAINWVQDTSSKEPLS